MPQAKTDVTPQVVDPKYPEVSERDREIPTAPVAVRGVADRRLPVDRARRAVEPVTFTDVTKESRITFSHVWSTDKKYILESMSGGVALFDFDNDGLLDVLSRQLPHRRDGE